MSERIKRVFGFLDIVDEIPVNAKYLFSKEFKFPTTETEEQVADRIIHGKEVIENTTSLFKHYYEVEEVDFKKVMDDNKKMPELKNKVEKFNKKFNTKI